MAMTVVVGMVVMRVVVAAAATAGPGRCGPGRRRGRMIVAAAAAPRFSCGLHRRGRGRRASLRRRW